MRGGKQTIAGWGGQAAKEGPVGYEEAIPVPKGGWTGFLEKDLCAGL